MDSEDSDLYTQLSLHAKRASVVLVQLATDVRNSESSDGTLALMAKVGGKLFLLAYSLECATKPIDPSVQRYAENILRILWEAFSPERRLDDEKLLQVPLVEIYSDLEMRLDHYDFEDTKSLVMDFFQQLAKEGREAGRLGGLCDKVQYKVRRVDKESISRVPENVNVPEPNGYDKSLNKDLCSIIQEHTMCVDCPKDTEASISILGIPNVWHPTRLRLGGPRQCDRWAVFDVMTSSLQLTFWKEFRWILPTREDVQREENSENLKHEARQTLTGWEEQVVGFKDDKDKAQYDPPRTVTCLSQGYICERMGIDEPSRVELQLVPNVGVIQRDYSSAVEPLLPDVGLNLSSVLLNYGPLTIKDKIVLGHTIAQAFWQLYASDLMQSVWTSETIWFMPKDRSDLEEKAPDRLPMDPYIAFNFGPHETVDEWLDPKVWKNISSATHRFPHILALGVLLLEIGLGKEVAKSEIKCDLRRGSVVRLSGKAKTGLKTLMEKGIMEWDGLVAHKACFARAIGYCLDSKNWTSSQQPAKAALIGASGRTAPANDVDNGAAIARRKEILYRNVIRPLAWLVKSFYEDRYDVTCAYTLDTLFLPRRPTTVKPEQRAPSELPRLFPGEDTSSGWLRVLHRFNDFTQSLPGADAEQIEAGGNQSNATSESYSTTFKIAILDTGYNPDMPFFKNPKIRERITWKDFVVEHHSSTAIDEYGHGSFMTRLVMESSPLAHVYVIRIARREDGFSTNKDAIAQAIRWAGITEKVDIISMSFGLDEDDQSVANISQAIVDVDKERQGKVIYFASAGNDPTYHRNIFPARHDFVLAIYATDPMGKFLSHPSNPDVILGTYGKGVPTEILNEIKEWYPEASTNFEPKPGSSIATAIAAGIAATILTHVAALRWPLRPCPQEACQQRHEHYLNVPLVLDRLTTRRGMKELMQNRMATTSGGSPQRLFLNPIARWKRASTNGTPLGMGWKLLTSVYSGLPP